MARRWHGGFDGRSAEQAGLGTDSQAAIQTVAGQLRRPRPGAAQRAAHLHREDGRRTLAVRRAPADRARRVDAAGGTPGGRAGPRASPWASTPATWLAQRSLKHRTKAHYAALLANHITPRLGAVALRNLTPAAVRAWYAALDPAHRTANSHAYALLHGICATAVGDGLLTDNPCQIKRAMNTPRQRQPVILTVAEVAAAGRRHRAADCGPWCSSPRGAGCAGAR